MQVLDLVRENKTEQIALRVIAADALYDVSGFAFDGTQYHGFPK